MVPRPLLVRRVASFHSQISPQISPESIVVYDLQQRDCVSAVTGVGSGKLAQTCVWLEGDRAVVVWAAFKGTHRLAGPFRSLPGTTSSSVATDVVFAGFQLLPTLGAVL